jgi:hypothetical protein
MIVSPANSEPTLRLLLAGDGDAQIAADVIFPEHVSARKHGSTDVEHLYLFRPGQHEDRPAWRRVGQSLEYEADLKEGIHLLARATLEADGVLFHYEFVNLTGQAYDMIYAVTDPRMGVGSVFHDARLERTYVHRKEGFVLLGAETPERLTEPMNEWLPARYLASYTWPVPALLKDKRGDGITYYNTSWRVDEPMIATVSSDGKWVFASFTRTVGNVWSNPELTCQHVDPEVSLAAMGKSVVEVKELVFAGSLEIALTLVDAQKGALR